MLLAVILIVAILSGCGSTGPVQVTVVFVPDAAAYCQNRLKNTWSTACAFWNTVDGQKSCAIFITETDYKESPATLGHELRHCFEGNFHSEVRP